MEPKQVVKLALAEHGLTLTALAARLGKPQQSFSRTLQTSPLDTRSHWPAILEALGLELVVQKKRQD